MKEPRWPTKHPWCTCPELTISGPTPDRTACAGGTAAHPVLTGDEIRQLLDVHRQP